MCLLFHIIPKVQKEPKSAPHESIILAELIFNILLFYNHCTQAAKSVIVFKALLLCIIRFKWLICVGVKLGGKLFK